MSSWLILYCKKNMKKNRIIQKPWYCYLLTQFDTFSRGDNLINVVVDIIQKVRGHRFLRWIIPQLQLLYHLSPKTTNSKVVYFCKDKTTVTYIKLLILSKKNECRFMVRWIWIALYIMKPFCFQSYLYFK